MEAGRELAEGERFTPLDPTHGPYLPCSGVQLRLDVLAGVVLGKGDGKFGTDLEFSPLLNL
ncbi:MAG: hypothetical protein OXH85_09635 [Truepera sp.]|nr:hypothetical protein [Truepera sp.]